METAKKWRFRNFYSDRLRQVCYGAEGIGWVRLGSERNGMAGGVWLERGEWNCKVGYVRERLVRKGGYGGGWNGADWSGMAGADRI